MRLSAGMTTTEMMRAVGRLALAATALAGFAGTLRAQDAPPPVETPPVVAPPVQAPPVQAPPVQAPPAVAPPVQAPQVAPGAVREIVIRGNVRVSQQTILTILRSKVGGAYVQATVDEDENALYDTGFFSAVKINATPLEGETWRLTVDVAEYPEIREIQVTGNSAVPTEDILRVVQYRAGEVFNLKAARPTQEAIEKLYRSAGLLRARRAARALAELAGHPRHRDRRGRRRLGDDQGQHRDPEARDLSDSSAPVREIPFNYRRAGNATSRAS